MKTHQLAVIILLVLAAGGGGYTLRGLQSDLSTSRLTSLPELDLFICEQSFSEVENAKALLQALSERYINEVRVRRYLDIAQSTIQGHNPSPANEPNLPGTIDILEKGVEAFAGTGQEQEVAYDLLRVLKKAGMYDRWIEVYLHTLYEHPTHGLVEFYAGDAVAISQTVGRECEVLRGFRHLSSIPFDFAGKQRVKALLALPGKPDQLSQNDDRSLPFTR